MYVLTGALTKLTHSTAPVRRAHALETINEVNTSPAVLTRHRSTFINIWKNTSIKISTFLAFFRCHAVYLQPQLSL